MSLTEAIFKISLLQSSSLGNLNPNWKITKGLAGKTFKANKTDFNSLNFCDQIWYVEVSKIVSERSLALNSVQKFEI